jgi:hypothetical protein
LTDEDFEMIAVAVKRKEPKIYMGSSRDLQSSK